MSHVHSTCTVTDDGFGDLCTSQLNDGTIILRCQSTDSSVVILPNELTGLASRLESLRVQNVHAANSRDELAHPEPV